MTNYQRAQSIAMKIKASDYGVCITTAFIGGMEHFSIWKLVGNKIVDHNLLCSATDDVRLQLHAEGFIANQAK